MSKQERLEKTQALWRDVSWEEMATFIGPNAEAYKELWQKQRDSFLEKGRPPMTGFSLCWPAMIPIFGIPWGVSRKLWTFVGSSIFVVVLINILTLMAPSKNVAGVSLIMWFMMAFMAMPTYLQMSMMKIDKIKQKIAEGPARDAALRDAGGLNMNNGYIAGAICAVFMSLNIWSFVNSVG
jgi:hypothetical protein